MRACRPAMPPRRSRRRRDRRAVAAAASADVDLCGGDRGQPGHAHRASSERRDRRRRRRRWSARCWCATGSPRAGSASAVGADGSCQAMPGPSWRRIKSGCPAACRPIRSSRHSPTGGPSVMNEQREREARRPSRSSFRCATRPTTSRRWSPRSPRRSAGAALRGHLRQRRLDRRDRGRADAAEGAAAVAAPGQARRHPAGSRRRCAPACAAARAPVIVTLDGDGQNDPASSRSCSKRWSGRAARRPGRGPARRPQGHRLQEIAVAHRQRRARRDPARRHARHRLRAQGVSAAISFLALPYFDGLHRFLPALVRREGYEIGYVDVIDRPRQHGISNYGLWDRLWVGILDLVGVWWLIRRRKRVPEVSEVTEC